MPRSPVRTDGGHNKWTTLTTAGRIDVLSDELVAGAFTEAIGRISGKPAQQRVREKPSLGEIMVLAHASTLAQEGANAFVLIDEGDGRRRARKEIAWLSKTGAPGSITMWSTVQVLQHAGTQKGWIKHGLTWQQVYAQMRPFDDGLPPLDPLRGR